MTRDSLVYHSYSQQGRGSDHLNDLVFGLQSNFSEVWVWVMVMIRFMVWVRVRSSAHDQMRNESDR